MTNYENEVYIQNHLLQNWKKIINIIHQKTYDHMKENNLGYAAIHVTTNNHWTFAFLCTKQSPNTLYYKFSDHDDGVHSRNYDAEKGYAITSNTPCVKGQNTMKDSDIYFCVIEKNQIINYTLVNWLEGKIS